MATANDPDPPEPVIKKLIIPLFLSIIFGLIMLYGGEAYQATGLAALENTRKILSYAVGIIEFFVLAILIQRIVQYIVLDRLVAAALGTPTPRLLSQLATFIIYALAIGAIVGVVFKKDLTVILTAFGGAGLVIGLAIQGIIFDLVAGLIINLDRSIRIGDCIRFTQDSNIIGEVQEISWRNTRILDTECSLIIVPNSKLFSAIVTNYALPSNFIEIDVTVTMSDKVPSERVFRILLSAAATVAPLVVIPESPPPNAKIKAITLAGVEYVVQIYPTFKTRAKARNLLHLEIMRHLTFAGLSPAQPKQVYYNMTEELGSDVLSFNPKHLANILKRTALFQDLASAELELLAAIARLHTVPANTRVIAGGEIATSMFLIMEGILIAEEWRKKVGKKASEITPEKLLVPGTLISGSAMLAGGSYEFTLRSKGTVLFCEIDYAAIEQLFLQNPQSSRYLSLRVAEELSLIRPNVDLSELTAEVFRSLRRSYAHLKLD